MKWRKWNNILHRDLGYLAVGLTIIYSISGLAVNHVADWNPSYQIEYSSKSIDISDLTSPLNDEDIARIVLQTGIEAEVESLFYPQPQQVRIFLENQTLDVNLENGDVKVETITERPFLQEFNAMHLNHPKKLWTWMADIYAVVLIILAVTGLFVLKGKNGISGRGSWLTAIGIIIPIAIYMMYQI